LFSPRTSQFARVHQSSRRRCRGFSRIAALTIVDLACETGSMLRALAPHLPALQNGKLVDNDLDLLVRAADVFHPAPGVATT
jgi:hypothetical protein